MPNHTTNYNLKKPLTTENYDVADQNGNMDLIDAALNSKMSNSLATAADQFLVSSGVGSFIVKTIAQIKTLLGLGSAAYTESTDYTPASHLADTLHDKGSNLDFARCYAENVFPLFDGTEVYSGGSGTTYADDIVNVKIGSKSQKMTSNGTNAFYAYGSSALKAFNLSIFQDGSTGTTSDYIRFCFYVSDVTKVASVKMQLWTTMGSAWFTYTIANASLITGWNYIDILKSAFSTGGGSPNWNSITYVELGWTTQNTPSTAYVSFQSIQLVRKDPLSAIPNPFQQKVNGTYERIFAINSGFWFVGLEFGEVACRDLNPTGVTYLAASALLGTKAYTDNFNIFGTFICKSAGYVAGFVYRVDNANFVYIEVYTNTLYIQSYIVGVGGTTYTIPFTCALNDVVFLQLNKKGTTFSGIAFKNGDISTQQKLTLESAVTGNGYIGISSFTPLYQTIKSLSITTVEHADHANVADWAKSVGMGTWEVIETKILIANQIQVDFVGISSEWKALKLLYTARNTVAIGDLYLRVNDDATAGHYEYVHEIILRTGVTAGGAATTALIIDNGLTFPVGAYQMSASGEITFLPKNSWWRSILFDVITAKDDLSVAQNTKGVGYWFDSLTGASSNISKISLLASTNAIIAGSTFTLMGVK